MGFVVKYLSSMCVCVCVYNAYILENTKECLHAGYANRD